MTNPRLNRALGAALGASALAALVMIAPHTVVRNAAAAQSCDCSCEVFAEFKSRMEKLSEAAEAGEAVTMSPELHRAAACGAQCAVQWSQCDRDASADTDTGRPASEDGSTGSSAAQGDAAAGAATSQDEGGFYLGEPRDDLERFYGVYGDGDSGRNFFVAPAEYAKWVEKTMPPGYLMIGAMWGDVAPWYMKSVSDTRFEQQRPGPGGEAVVAEFALDDAGRATAITFQTVFDDRGRLQRLGDLPEGW